ncbi:MAG: DNA-binding response regulator [Ignavibacteriaceae bacterium]|jgi:DNA-binding NarL/FixJ family response regulator|nr:response regulator transcription factor [Ignavibacteriaceae bacterium]MCZ7615115.1 response regulator transcription factor [Ignavibacteriaceae bacterium]MEB2296772.1 response regulator transcription factor [Ignavibacteria bacterium]GIK59448.1 MAG: DNA-binding response regulator [Ignavibacteriota bacterium]GJQ41244.1 MAG: DNA-binding response regulator [Ignavibacteriaceae bacterium]
MNDKKISVVIVEDDEQIRKGISALIESADEFVLKGAFADCQTLLSKLDDILPDVFIMDISMPGMSGIECVSKIKSIYPAANIVMLTVYEDDAQIFDSLRAGASGYILKRTPLEQILDAIKDVNAGGAPMTPSIAKRVLSFFNEPDKKTIEYNLTRREKEILQELVNGLSYKKIADTLFISLDTVRSHIKNIYQKLHVSSKSGAVAKALKDKIF